MSVPDVLVLGLGPAGLAACAALAQRGLRVASLAPADALHWPAEYGAWADALQSLGLEGAIGHRWPDTAVALGDGEQRLLGRAYARLDKAALAEALRARCERGGVHWLRGSAGGVIHDDACSAVRCRDGREHRARLVVDATGHRPALLRRRYAGQGFQTAFGLTLDTDVCPWRADRAVLMDWGDEHLPPEERRAGPPTFLYAMPLAAGRLFVEETVLVGRPAVPVTTLERRLRLRLARLGIPAQRAVATERVWIPMGGPLPRPAERTVGFGAAAGMVHPATGYLLTRTLAAAPALADAVRDGLDRSTPAAAARAAWAALWPADRRRRHALFGFGMEGLLRLDAAATRDFFRSFWALPEPTWRGYLDDTLPARELTAAMGRLFLSATPRVRRSLLRLGAGPHGARLALRIAACA